MAGSAAVQGIKVLIWAFWIPGRAATHSSLNRLEKCLSDSFPELKVGTVITFHLHALEKEMATHSSVLAWRIPGTGEPGGLLSVGLHRVRHD